MKNGWKPLFAWIRHHKIRTLVILLLVYLAIEIATIPFWSIARLASENPDTTALIAQRSREAIEGGKPLRVTQKWISINRLPRHVVRAIIVAEDGAFYDHEGVDWYEVGESVKRNIRERRFARGASTITQQLAKNLYLSTSKTPLRKGKEVIIAALLEHNLSKQRILELYVNVIEWGHGVFGIEAAARKYFGKPASQLDRDEAARLAAVIPRPLRFRPDENSRYVTRRAATILARMGARAGDSGGSQQPERLPRLDEEEVDPVTEPSGDEQDSVLDNREQRNGL